MGYFGQLSGSKGFFFFFFFFFDILVILVILGGILAIIVISTVFLSKFPTLILFIFFLVRITKIAKKLSIPQNTLRIAKMTKMHYECPKYPKNQENDQNAPKTSKTTTLPPPPLQKKTFKMSKIPLKPQNMENTLEAFANDQDTPKP